mgnify:CR=1 FL=1
MKILRPLHLQDLLDLHLLQVHLMKNISNNLARRKLGVFHLFVAAFNINYLKSVFKISATFLLYLSNMNT